MYTQSKPVPVTRLVVSINILEVWIYSEWTHLTLWRQTHTWVLVILSTFIVRTVVHQTKNWFEHSLHPLGCPSILIYSDMFRWSAVAMSRKWECDFVTEWYTKTLFYIHLYQYYEALIYLTYPKLLTDVVSIKFCL